MEDRCVCCGEIIPEGQMACPNCLVTVRKVKKMARLIDADLAIAKVKDDGILGSGYSDSERIDDVCDMIDSCPTVDAVEVVRCKDCVAYNANGCAEGFGLCDAYNLGKMDYDFCSLGAKMEQPAENSEDDC